MESILSN
jgi:magnesium-transporting ATPase (P-type)